jgi:hypothetical protein
LVKFATFEEGIDVLRNPFAIVKYDENSF